MTSKERLEKVADYLEKSAAPDIADEIKKCVSNIESDSEVLEIFKKYLTIEIDDKPIFNGTYSTGLKKDENDEWDYTIIYLTKEEKDLLKEVFEDDEL